MVAYSFQKMFADPIIMGGKTQTIRAHRRRHAREGEELQLYTGMRTKQCRLIGRATCLCTIPIRIEFSTMYPGDVVVVGDGPRIWQGDLDRFARSDGFDGWKAMRAFWEKHHPNMLLFTGVIIYWKDLQIFRPHSPRIRSVKSSPFYPSARPPKKGP